MDPSSKLGTDASITDPIDVAIVGGGIGGLALTIGLLQYPHVRVRVYEAASQFSEIGGIFYLFPHEDPLKY